MALDGTLMFGTEIDNSGFENGLNNLKQIGNTALGMLAADIAKQIGDIAAQIPAQMLSVGSGFEASMSQVAATMGMTAESAEFEILSTAASEMGETTKFSASQVAEALNYLALAGYDTEKAVGALPTVLNVAAAGGMELASGAAAQMAETMDDNLKGDLTIMQSALEGLGIAAYEKFQEPMRTAVQEVTASIGGLTSSLNDGELSESMDKVAEGFGNVVSSATQLLADDVLPAAVDGLAWLADNTETLITAAASAAVGIGAYTLATQGATVATQALSAAASLNPFGVVAAGAIAAATAFAIYVQNMDMTVEVSETVTAIDNETDALKRQREEFKELKRSQNEKLMSDVEQINSAESLWNELKKYVDENGNVVKSNGRAVEIIGTLNEAYGLNIEYINGQIDGYGDLTTAMEGYFDSLRLQAKIDYLKPAYTEAAANEESTKQRIEELKQRRDEALAEFEALREEANGIDDNYEKALKLEEGDFKAAEWNSIKLQIIEAEKQLAEYQETIKKFEGLSAEKISPNSGINEYADNTISDIEDAGEKIILTQEEVNDKLKNEWDNLNHAYAMGAIASDEELYARKSALLEQYGNENLSEHWKYYEELYDQQQEFAEKSQKASEDAAKKAADVREQEWDNISRLSDIGLITEEEAYRKRLEWIQKYCPEYADEWQSYYKTIIDCQRDAMNEQIKDVKSGISEAINEYKKAYSELEGYMSSYKKRLLSVGNTFSIEESDGNKYYSVESLSKQKADMQKYHNYVKQLKDRGMSQEVLSEMTSYDFDDGMYFAENLAKMSDAELKEISRLYDEKKKLADDLTNELYAPEMEKLNTDLVNGVIAEFGTLPDDIKEIGAAALAAFIEGISETENLSEKITDFTDSFFTACNDGIENGIAGLNLTDRIMTAFDGQDTYAVGKEKGNALVDGFNDALNGLYAQFEDERMLFEFQAQANLEQSYMAKEYSRKVQEAPNSYSKGSERIVVENHVNTTVQLDKDVVGKSAYEYSKEFDRKSGI